MDSPHVPPSAHRVPRPDPLGNTVTKTYNSVTGKLLTKSDALGRVTTTAYPASGREFERMNPISVTDPLGRVTSYGYRLGDLSLPGDVPNSITEPLGRTANIGQDTKGNRNSK